MLQLEVKPGVASTLAELFSEALRTRSEEVRSTAEEQERASLDQLVARVTGERVVTLVEELVETAEAGNKCYSICYMYVEGYNTDLHSRFHTPSDIAARFGEAMCDSVRAIDPGLDVDYSIHQWGIGSAYPEVTIRW